MSVDARGLLKGKVEVERVLNFIQQKYDKNAKINSRNERNGDDDIFTTISFSVNNEDRTLSYSYEKGCAMRDFNINSDEEYTWIKLGHDNTGIMVIKDLVTEFGGYLDENDCDDKGFEPIEKNPDETIKPIHIITMSEVYEKFGGMVIIKDR